MDKEDESTVPRTEDTVNFTQNNTENKTMEEEIASLKEQLEEARAIVRLTQEKMHSQQIEFNCTMTLLKRQLHQCKHDNASIVSRRDQHLQQVMSQIMLLEARIRRERKHILAVLHEKDTKIKQLVQDNQELRDKNERLTFVVNVLSRKSLSTSMDNLLNVSPEGQLPPVSEKDKGSLRGKFSFMKGKLRRHRSTLDLQSNSDSNLFSSNCDLQNFLGLSDEKNNSKVTLRQTKYTSRERCNSTPGVLLQWDNLFDAYSKQGMQNGETCIPEEDVIDEIGRNGVFELSPSDKTRDDTMCNSKHPQNRSMPDIQTGLTSDDPNGSANLSGDDGSQSDSNPLKTFKSIIKRKGSKLKGKKRSISLPQGVNEEYRAALQKQYQQRQK